MFLSHYVSIIIIVKSLHQISGVTKGWSLLHSVKGAIEAQFNRNVFETFLSLFPCVLSWIVTSHKSRVSPDNI